MQVLDVQPTNPTPYTPAGGTYNNNPVPGAGGLPSLSGLTRNVNPLANELQGQGRGEDSVLVHMTPNEVNSLRGLAQAFGGDLSVNPNTGLPEAGFLSKILPTLLGVGLNFILPGSGIVASLGGKAATAGLITAAGTTAVTGDLQKGLMAGLGAYGGASMAGALTAPPTAPVPTGAAEVNAVAPSVPAGATSAAMPVPVAEGLAGPPGLQLPGMAPSVGGAQVAAQLPGMAPTALAPTAAVTPPPFATPPSKGMLGKLGSDFSTAARGTMKAGTLPYKLAPAAAGIGVLGTASDLLQPEFPAYEKEEDKWKYEGPYMPMPRRYNPRVRGEGEISFFEESNPYPGYLTRSGGLPTGFAEGGETKKGLTLSNVSGSPATQAPAVPVPTMGAQLAANLPKFISQFQTSPGPITASRTYEGGSPYERIRAAAAAPKTEMDFGFAKTAGTNPNGMSAYTPYVNSVLSQYYNPATNGFDFSSLTPELIESYTKQYDFTGRPADIAGPVREFAKGGVHMDDGAFVVDARTVSELGNGSSSAGQELLARLGGRPVKGPGDGVSDSIPANIGGKQKARVARDEVIFPAKAVKRLGGAKKLYALMDKAHKARKKAKRGSDTKLRKGLGAL